MSTIRYDDIFELPGECCDDARIAEIEKNVGHPLPAEYRELMKTTGGGIVSDNAGMLPMRFVRDPYEDAWFLDRIYGNGTLQDGDDEDIALDSSYLRGLIREHGISDKLLVFCELEGGLDECLAINYGMLRYPPPHSIVLVDSELGKTKLVARSFSSFLSRLREQPEEEWTLKGKRAAKSGDYSEELQKIIDSSCLTEKAVREQARRLLKQNSVFALMDESEANAMRDIMFLGMYQYREVKTKRITLRDPQMGLRISACSVWSEKKMATTFLDPVRAIQSSNTDGGIRWWTKGRSSLRSAATGSLTGMRPR